MFAMEQNKDIIRLDFIMDRRQQKTRDAIFDAFGMLLTEKSFSKITVQEIIDAANVGRTTFYAHFPTKDDLLRDMCAEIFDHVFSDAPRAENTHDFSVNGRDTTTAVTHVLYHLRDSRKNILGILSSESGDLLLTFFRQYLNKSLAMRMLDGVRPADSVPMDFLVNHISGSFISMVQWWVENGLRETPEEMARYFMSVTDPILSVGNM